MAMLNNKSLAGWHRVISVIGASGLAALSGLAAAMTLTGAVARAAGPGPAPKVVSASLIDVSCKGGSFCMASGVYDTRQRKGNRLAEEWDGKGWRDVRDSATGHLTEITCGSASFCFAGTRLGLKVGPAAEWNGRTWQVYKNSVAAGATCGSPKLCMRVVNFGTDIDVWNGKSWKINPDANACSGGPPDNPDCSYDSLSCGSASNCLGFFHACTDENCVEGPNEFDSSWNGSHWDIEGFDTPTEGELSCSPGRFCMNLAGPHASIWDSAGWQDASPDLASLCTSAQNCSLNGPLSCGAAQNCLILPSGSPMSLLWSHLTWQAVPLAKIAGQVPALAALSCGSAGNCMAVGSYGTPSHPVAEHWNGTKWQLTKPVNH
jgi:hypothetical protein